MIGALTACGATVTATPRLIRSTAATTGIASPASPLRSELVYRTATGAAVPAADLARLRGRLAQLGFTVVSLTSGGGRVDLVVDGPVATTARAAGVGRPYELRMYDWEANALGRKGRPVPLDPAVTGDGVDSGGSQSGVSRADATRRARRAPNAIVVRAMPDVNANGTITDARPNRWYAIEDRPSLTGTDLARAQAGVDPNSGQPDVTFRFTRHGALAFATLTRRLSRRGLDAQLPGVPKIAAEQHLAVVIDRRIVAVASIDYTEYPQGIDPTEGSEIAGALTPTGAQLLAAALNTGPLSRALTLVSVRPTSPIA